MGHPTARTAAGSPTEAPHRLRRSPHYGIDAPAVAAALLGGGVAGGAVATRAAHRAPPWVTLLAGGAALSAGLTGLSMVLYSRLGKQRLRDHLLRQRRWRGDEVVLDVGAGRGLMAIAAAHRAPAGRVTAVDMWSRRDLSGNTPSALARNASIENVAERVAVVTGDARRLDAGTGTVDVVASVFCLHNITPTSERLTACREIARVLQPGGTAVIADFPTVRPYVEAFRDAGLHVDGPFRAERFALGVAGYLVATKPAASPS